MACPDAIPVPGGNAATPAAWSDLVTLTASGTGYVDFVELTVTVQSGDATPRPVEIVTASPNSVVVKLPGPPEAAHLAGPHSLIVKGPVSGTCAVDILVTGVAVPAEPTEEDLRAVLTSLAARVELSLAGMAGRSQGGLPSIPPGSGTYAALEGFPPFVTPAGTRVPAAMLRTFRGPRDRIPVDDIDIDIDDVVEDPGVSGVPPGTIPIRPTVTWTLVRADGSELVEGEDYLEDSFGAGAAGFTIVPPISKSPNAAAQKLSVKATGTLTAHGSAIGRSDVSVPLPNLVEDLVLETLALPVPLFAGCRLEKFAPVDGDGAIGAAYVQVPPGWTDQATDELAPVVMDAIDLAREVLRPLDRIVWIAELLTGMRMLGRVLSAQSLTIVETKLVVEDLEDYRWFKHDHWYGWDSWFEDLYVHDRISSFAALGLRGQAVQCFAAKDNDAGQEWLEVTFTDPVGVALVDRLRTKTPASRLGRGALVTPKVAPKDEDDLYDESFSSITLVE